MPLAKRRGHSCERPFSRARATVRPSRHNIRYAAGRERRVQLQGSRRGGQADAVHADHHLDEAMARKTVPPP